MISTWHRARSDSWGLKTTASGELSVNSLCGSNPRLEFGWRALLYYVVFFVCLWTCFLNWLLQKLTSEDWQNPPKAEAFQVFSLVCDQCKALGATGLQLDEPFICSSGESFNFWQSYFFSSTTSCVVDKSSRTRSAFAPFSSSSFFSSFKTRF